MTNLSKLKDAIRGQKLAAAIQVTIDLGTAHAKTEYRLEGSSIQVEVLNGSAQVWLNSSNGDAWDLGRNPSIEGPFSCFYVSNDVQAGGILRLLVCSPGFVGHPGDVISPTGAYLAPTSISAGSTATIWTPGSGKRLRLGRLSMSTDTATRLDLLWTATAWESFFLPANGSLIVNLTGSRELGPSDGALVVKSSVTATVTARATGEQV